MNKDQIEKYQERSLRKKYNMLHMLPTLSSKALSGLYYKNFHNSVKRYQITLPEQLRNGKFCSYCGSTYVPNFNATLQITIRAEQDALSKPGNKNMEAPKKCVTVDCLNCGKSTLFEWEPSMIDLAIEQDTTITTNSTTNRKVAPAVEMPRKGKVCLLYTSRCV